MKRETTIGDEDVIPLTQHESLKHETISFNSDYDSKQPIELLQVDSKKEFTSVHDKIDLKDDFTIRTEQDENKTNQFKFEISNTGDISEQPFKCELCDYRTKTRYLLKKHSYTHEKPYKCKFCDYRTARNQYLKRHIVKHTDENVGISLLSCDICDYKTVSGYSLKMHTTVHSIHKPIKCNLCDYQTKRNDHLRTHMKLHANACGGEWLQCEQCEYKTSRKNHLIRHMEIHSEVKQFRCTFCEYKCRRKRQLTEHMYNHTGRNTYQCDICGQKMARKRNLISHMNIHRNYKPHQCSWCEFRTAHETSLTKHMKRVHSDDRLLKCNMCNYKCEEPEKLKEHVLTHPNGEFYECDKCRYITLHQYNFIKHALIHTDEHLTCPICKLKFKRKTYLNEHMVKHTGEKPFKCDKCKYMTKRSKDLKGHIKRKHNSVDVDLN